MADETPNRVTLALVDAKVATVVAQVDALGTLIQSENAATRSDIAELKGLPVQVATLKAGLAALDSREQLADQDMDRRVSAIETGRARAVSWKVSAGIACAAALIGGAFGHIHIPL